ncbi:uncharacterized protein [Phyllobates terribilis]|uniref:uncharacterized protein n=1 Tax=Phyllobates terribilis TaxID=111132 RepID=UPI003CCA6E26
MQRRGPARRSVARTTRGWGPNLEASQRRNSDDRCAHLPAVRASSEDDLRAGGQVPAGPTYIASSAHGISGPAQIVGSKGDKDKDDNVRLDDSAKGEVYVCFEGPLGAHLKPEVREKIWKGEYVDIFSLLPLERFNLDRFRKDVSKKEDEEKRRLRKELRDDLGIWAQFLESYNGKSVWIAPVVNASELALCIDVSRKQGFAILFRVRSIPVAGTSGIINRFSMPSRTMESSLRAVKKLIGQSLSTRTWSSYEVAWQQWEEWKATMGDPLESDSLLLLLVGHCWEEGWSVPKINNFMAGLAFGFKIRGLPDVTKATLVRQALKGWRKGWKVRDCRRPISYGLLLALGQLLGSVCKSPWEVKLFRLAFSLAFFGALRLVELVSPSRFVNGGLLKVDVNLYSDRIEVFIRFSKTDQFRKGCKVVLFAVAGSDMCPVRCLSKFGLGVVGFKSPLLVHEDGSFLSRFQFVTVLKKCLEAGGISPKDYSGHSFRIGAATEAARRGLGDELVKKIGRWESIRFRSYIRPAWV